MNAVTDRRAVLGAVLAGGAAAGVTALALPAAVIAAPVDPIFAAIAQHIVARDALIEAIPRADEVTAKLEGREVTKADEDAVEALNLDEEAAFLEAVRAQAVGRLLGRPFALRSGTPRLMAGLKGSAPVAHQWARFPRRRLWIRNM